MKNPPKVIYMLFGTDHSEEDLIVQMFGPFKSKAGAKIAGTPQDRVLRYVLDGQEEFDGEDI